MPVVSITSQVTSYTHELLLFEGNFSYMIPIIMKKAQQSSPCPYYTMNYVVCSTYWLLGARDWSEKYSKKINLWGGNCGTSKLNSVLRIKLYISDLKIYIYLYNNVFLLCFRLNSLINSAFMMNMVKIAVHI